MCGIIGYVGSRNAGDIIFECLKKLDYRGYDSWGIAVVSNPAIHVAKKAGRLPAGKSGIILPKATVGIGHTRWATHGGVSEKNAHPHLSNNGKIAVVHNGIIENHEEQRKFLSSQGFAFASETDTENIPNTIEYHMRKGYGFIEASKRALRHLTGQYAIVAVNDKGSMVAIRKEAPLVIGVGDKGEYFAASDVTAFLNYTKKAIFLEEGDMTVIGGKSGIKIFSLPKNEWVQRQAVSIDWDPEKAEKGVFEHFFMKEIAEQAEMAEKLAAMGEGIIKEVAGEIKKAKGICIVACGTAYHACMSGAYLFSKIAKMHINVCPASEFQHFRHFLKKESIVIAVSQSGETADTLCAIRAAKECGAKVISITNGMHSSLMRESDKCILQKVGPEIAVNSTKAYTSQLGILTLIAYELAGKFEEGRGEFRDLVRYIYYLTSVSMRTHLQRLADMLKGAEHLYLFGRGLQYPTALEASHKIKEVSYIHSEAYPGGELKHGMLALIEPGVPCIVFTSDDTEKDIINNAAELKARGAYLIGVGPRNNELFDFFIKVREAGNFNSICQIIPMQVLAYQLAVLRGCDPDYPRNLAKSVVVR